VATLAASVRPAQVLTAAGGLLVVAAGTWWLLRSPASAVEDELPFASGATTSAVSAGRGVGGTSPAPTVGPGDLPDDLLIVQAAGAVARPGVYRVRAGSRVTDLVAAAGGPAAGADLDALALAARLTDGQRVYVPRHGEVVVASTPPGGSAAPSPDAPLDLNTATAGQLDALPGIGPATAAAIVSYRERDGPFRAVDDLLDVRGIGPAKLDAVRELVRV
jgi:competence protein ComEA